MSAGTGDERDGREGPDRTDEHRHEPTPTEDVMDEPRATAATSTHSTGTTSTTGVTADPPAEPRGPAVGTLAWGLVTLAVAAVLLLREVTDVTVDLSYALPIGMVALGLLLVVGAVLTGTRRR